jgi:hypothetical protein
LAQRRKVDVLPTMFLGRRLQRFEAMKRRMTIPAGALEATAQSD